MGTQTSTADIFQVSVTWRWLWALTRRWCSRPQRRLRLCENLPLGDHRFVAVVEFERQKFLIGGAGNSLSLLAALPGRVEPAIERPGRCVDPDRDQTAGQP